MLQLMVVVNREIKAAEARMNAINPFSEADTEYQCLGKWRKASAQQNDLLAFLWVIKTGEPTLATWLRDYAPTASKTEGIEHHFNQLLWAGLNAPKYTLDHNRGHGWEIRGYMRFDQASEVMRFDPLDLLLAFAVDVDRARRGLPLHSGYLTRIEECLEGEKGGSWGLSRYIQQDLEEIKVAETANDPAEKAKWERSLAQSQAEYRFWKTLQEHPRLEEVIDELASKEDYRGFSYNEQWNHLISALFFGGPYTAKGYKTFEWGQELRLMHGTGMRLGLSAEIFKMSGEQTSDAYKNVGY